ncbi:Glutathione S-transferase-1 [Aphelenchoides bicaudatus]|nr:Glutathione S-transferase-1 [Aphelenchoides bicaudatus]
MLCRLIFLSIAIFVSIDKVESGTCADKVNSCDRAAAYCKLSSLQKTLRENCAVTCKFCKPTPGSRQKPRPRPPRPGNNLPKYKLHYFNFRFRAEAVRLMFNYKRVKFEDFKIDPKDWPSLKNNYPNKQIPALEIDGKMLMESGSIYRYVGRKFNLFGKDEVETAFLDSTAELFRELFDAATPYIQAKIGVLQNANPDDLFKNQFEPSLKNVAPQLVKKLGEQRSGFFSSQLSWVDFYVADAVFTFNGFVPQAMQPYPELLQHQKKVYALPELKQYIANRPTTPL